MSRDMTSVRYNRLRKVMALLQSRKEVSRRELESIGEYNMPANKTGKYVQNRTLQNDLDFLRDQGADIVYDRHKKLYILKNVCSFDAHLNITLREVYLLSAGLKMAAYFLPHLREDAEKMREKLDVYIPRELTDRGAELAQSTVMAIPAAPVKANVFEELMDAKYKKSAVQIQYISPVNKQTRQWILSPYDFYFRGNAWYMIAYNHKHNDLSIYRMSRIENVSLASEPYVPPKDAKFIKDYVATAWYVAPGSEKHFFKVHVEAGSLADSLREVRWHPTQKIEDDPNGGIFLTAEVPYFEDIAHWVLSNAPEMRPIEPKELKLMVRDFAKSIIENEDEPQKVE